MTNPSPDVLKRAVKVKLSPTVKQEILFNKTAGCVRFVYNYVLNYHRINYRLGGTFKSGYTMTKILSRLKKMEKYKWLNEVDSSALQRAVMNATTAYKRFFKGQARFPRYKSRRSRKSFYCVNQAIRPTSRGVKLAKIKEVKTFEPLPKDSKIYSGTVSFDGKDWYLSVILDAKDKHVTLTDNVIGVHLGVQMLATLSNGTTYDNINSTAQIKKIEKRLKHLQRKVSNKYEMNRSEDTYNKTQNIVKAEKDIRRLHVKLKNIRRTHLHQVTADIIKQKPKRIIVQNLDIQGMMKNKYFAEQIGKIGLYEFIRQLQYKTEEKGIEFIKADRFYPCSQLCSDCGNKQSISPSKQRYQCDHCGLTIDKGLNTSINLSRYKEPSV